jgi:hypothetical protein
MKGMIYIKEYHGFIPPCGIYCGKCPNFLRDKNPCPGAEVHCRNRKCKGIYVCCKEKKGYDYCYECKTFPCSRLKKFSENWMTLGQDLIKNQHRLMELGEIKWLDEWNN